MRDVSADPTEADWARLAELRASFLEGGSSARPETWRSARDLELYDATFAQRIAWKWDAVLAELALRGVELPAGEVVDWGCGTAIASRRWLAQPGGESVTRLHLWDHSTAARTWARERTLRDHPGLDVRIDPLASEIAPDVLLVSHVLSELTPEALDELVALARRSRFVAWIEAGSRDVSRELSAARDRLLDEYDVLAPCTHSAACGMLAPGQESNWCHHFARPPAEAFTSRLWTQFSKRLGVDLRSLPYSFIVMRRRDEARAQPSDEGRARVLGRPRIQKGRALLDSCDASGVRELAILERLDKRYFRRLADSAGEVLIERWTLDGNRIIARE